MFARCLLLFVVRWSSLLVVVVRCVVSLVIGCGLLVGVYCIAMCVAACCSLLLVVGCCSSLVSAGAVCCRWVAIVIAIVKHVVVVC